jgi:hypothetical protein
MSIGLNDIGSGVADVAGKTQPDSRDQAEENSADLVKAKLENDRLRQQNANLESDRNLRKLYADKIIAYLQVYSVCVLFLVVADALGWGGFAIPENALVTMVGSTAVAAIGLVGFVAKGLFK